MDHVRSRRGRRMRVHELLACGGPRSASCTRCDGVLRPGQRSGRSGATSLAGRRRTRNRQPPSPAHRHPTRPTRLGRGLDVRGDDVDAVLRRSVHRVRAPPRDHRARNRRPRFGSRGLGPRHLPHPGSRTHDPCPGRPRAADSGDHACIDVLRRLRHHTLHDLADSYATRFAAETEKWKSD